mgnify:CR=1 FL=1
MILVDFCLRRPVFTAMMTLAPVVIGLACYSSLKTALFPLVDLPIVAVTTVLPGASPEEVERQITRPVEEAVNTVSGINEIRSESRDGVSVVTVFFHGHVNRDAAVQEVRDKVAVLSDEFPAGTETPRIDKFDLGAMPVLSVAVSADRPLQEVTELARRGVKEELEILPGVGAVNLLGGRRRMVRIHVDPARLRKWGLSVDHVARAVGEQNVELPSGRTEGAARELTVRLMGRVTRPEELAALVVASPNGKPVTLGQVADVEDGHEDPRAAGRLRILGDPAAETGRPAVVLEILKQSSANTVEVADRIYRRLDTLRKVLPPDLRLEVVRDQSRFTRASMGEVKLHLLLGALLVAATVMLFMRDWRTTILASLSIPMSLAPTFIVMWLSGFTLDNITMMALVLSVGIVIDDAVVVHENIFRFIEEKGLPPLQAAAEATREIASAVAATTLSLVVIFLPLAFLGGEIGPFFRGFGITLAAAVLISMWVGFTMTPMLCAVFLKRGHNPDAHRGGRIYRAFDWLYGLVLRFSLRHRWVVVGLSIGAMALIDPLATAIGSDFIPKDDQGEFEILIRAPAGWTLDRTDAAAKAVETDLLREPRGIRAVVTTIGGTAGRSGNGQGDVTVATVYVGLTELEHRSPHTWQAVRDAAGLVWAEGPSVLLRPHDLWARAKAAQPHVVSQLDLIRRTRRMLAERHPDLRTRVRPAEPFTGAGAAGAELEMILSGPDTAALEELSARLVRELRGVRGMVDLDTTLELRKPEQRIHLDRAAAADRGVRPAAVAATLNALVGGERVGRYAEGDEQYDIRLRAAPDARDRAAALAELTVPGADGRLVPLGEVARLAEAPGPSRLERFQRRRQVTLQANLDGLPIAEAVAAVQAKAAAVGLPPDYTLTATGNAKTQAETDSNFGTAFGLAFLLMYMILAAQYESLVHPITILLSVPLTVPFALMSLWLLGQPMDLFSMFGIFMLFGIVKKNGILQVDATNQLRAAGMDRDAAILAANHVRLRPILMTTVMLVAGMIPVAMGEGPGAGARASMAKVIVGGQALSLLLTLLIVPVGYSLFDDVGRIVWWLRTRLSGARAEPEPPPPAEPEPADPPGA